MLSLILPVYNVEKYVDQCLSSILNQNLFDIQVIIVDDGSTDQSKKIAMKFCQEYPEIFEYHYKDNGGLSDARNFGVQYVKGEYIWFIDSDDFISYDAISTINECVSLYSPDLIIFDYYDFFETKIKSQRVTQSDNGFISKKDYILSNPCAWNKVIKTNLYFKGQIKYPDKLWYEDRATTGKYINACDKIYYINKPLYYYRQRENSIMNQNSFNVKMLDIIAAIEIMHEDMQCDIYYQELEYITLSNLIYQSAMRLISYNKFSDIKKCVLYCESLYPNWRENDYFKQRGIFFKLFCRLIADEKYFIARFIMVLFNIMK